MHGWPKVPPDSVGEPRATSPHILQVLLRSLCQPQRTSQKRISCSNVGEEDALWDTPLYVAAWTYLTTDAPGGTGSPPWCVFWWTAAKPRDSCPQPEALAEGGGRPRH